MSESVMEIVARVQDEIQQWANAETRGRVAAWQTVMAVFAEMERRMNAALPEGVRASLMNPRVEGSMIRADGWYVEHVAPEKSAEELAAVVRKLLNEGVRSIRCSGAAERAELSGENAAAVAALEELVRRAG